MVKKGGKWRRKERGGMERGEEMHQRAGGGGGAGDLGIWDAASGVYGDG